MSAVTYTAKREIISGHTVDIEYTIDLRILPLGRGKDVGKQEHTSLSGKSETVMWRNLREWQVTTGALKNSDADLVREFLESTVAGEQFEFDEFGSASVPDNAIAVVAVGTYSEQRAIQKAGDGGRNDYFRFSFSMRSVP